MKANEVDLETLYQGGSDKMPATQSFYDRWLKRFCIFCDTEYDCNNHTVPSNILTDENMAKFLLVVGKEEIGNLTFSKPFYVL